MTRVAAALAVAAAATVVPVPAHAALPNWRHTKCETDTNGILRNVTGCATLAWRPATDGGIYIAGVRLRNRSCLSPDDGFQDSRFTVRSTGGTDRHRTLIDRPAIGCTTYYPLGLRVEGHRATVTLPFTVQRRLNTDGRITLTFRVTRSGSAS